MMNNIVTYHNDNNNKKTDKRKTNFKIVKRRNLIFSRAYCLTFGGQFSFFSTFCTVIQTPTF